MERDYTPQIWRKQETILARLAYSDIDDTISEHFKRMIEVLTQRYPCRCLILDFSSLALVDGTGLASIVYALRFCEKKDIKLILCCLKPHLYDIMEKKGLVSMFEVFNTVHDALDMATYYTTLSQKQYKTSREMENIFGDSFEEKISY